MTQPGPGAQSGTPEGGQSADPGTGQGTPATDHIDPTGQSADPAQGQGQQTDPAATVTRAEFDALMARMRAADQNKAKAEAELKQLKDKDIPALEKAQRDLTEAAAAREKAEQDLRESRIQNAFLSDNKYEWHDPKTALKLADLSNVAVADDGTVSNLAPALEALAKAQPFLLKPKTEEQPKGSTGAPGSGGRQPDPKADANAMASRFPALRTRGVGGGNR